MTKRGYKQTKEHLAKLSKARKGRKMLTITKIKIANKLIGQKYKSRKKKNGSSKT